MFKVLGGGLTLFEGPDGFRPAEDSFWLSALAPPPPPAAHVLDIGCGTGAVGLIYKLRHPQVTLFGGDHTPQMLTAAAAAAFYNQLSFYLAVATINNLPYAPNSFDVCLANPPFYIEGREAPPKAKMRQNIRHTAHLENWLKALLEVTKPQGHVALICHANDAEKLIKIAPHYGGQCWRHFKLKTSIRRQAKRSVLIFIKGNATLAEIEIATFDKTLRRHALEGIVSSGKSPLSEVCFYDTV